MGTGYSTRFRRHARQNPTRRVSIRHRRLNQRHPHPAVGIHLRQRKRHRAGISPAMPAKFHQTQSTGFYVRHRKSPELRR